MTTLQDMEARREAIRSQLADIANIQDPSDDDVVIQDSLVVEHDELDKKIKPLRARMADLARIAAASNEPENREETAPGEAPTMFVRSNIKPLEDLDRVFHNLEKGEDLRVRAQVLIEQAENRKLFSREYADQAYHRSQDLGTEAGVSKHILLTGSDEYYAAFRAYMQNPFEGAARMNELPMAQRAINLTNASGGFLLPYILDPTIVLTNNASANPYRRVARIVQTTSNAWQGVNSAGVTAAWVAEAATAADNSPTVGQIQIVPEKAVAWVLGSYEVLDDTNFGEQLPGLLSDAKDRLESAAFSTGAGTASSQPLGILQSSGIVRVAPGATGTAFQSSTASTGGMADVMNLQAALPPRFRQSSSAAYLANINQLNRIRQVDVYGGAQFWTNLTTNTPAALVGQPVYEASDLPSATTGTSGASGTGNATLVYGDWAQFIICDRVGVSMLYDPMLKGSGNAQLPTGQAGWYMFWRVGSQVSTGGAFRYLTIS